MAGCDRSPLQDMSSICLAPDYRTDRNPGGICFSERERIASLCFYEARTRVGFWAGENSRAVYALLTGQHTGSVTQQSGGSGLGGT